MAGWKKTFLKHSQWVSSISVNNRLYESAVQQNSLCRTCVYNAFCSITCSTSYKLAVSGN